MFTDEQILGWINERLLNTVESLEMEKLHNTRKLAYRLEPCIGMHGQIDGLQWSSKWDRGQSSLPTGRTRGKGEADVVRAARGFAQTPGMGSQSKKDLCLSRRDRKKPSRGPGGVRILHVDSIQHWASYETPCEEGKAKEKAWGAPDSVCLPSEPKGCEAALGTTTEVRAGHHSACQDAAHGRETSTVMSEESKWDGNDLSRHLNSATVFWNVLIKVYLLPLWL